MLPTIRSGGGRKRDGFTLIEVMFAMRIIGLGIAALMQVFAAGTQVNGWGDYLSKGVFLAGECRSMTDDVGFDNLAGYDGQVFNGVDANGDPINGLQDYQQTIDVRMVSPHDLTLYVGPDPQAAILTTVVSHANDEITRMSWLRTK